jgi:hypothetical protein
MQRNLICVKWGPAYGPEYAINLYNGVKRYQDKNFAMHIFTDDASHLPTGKDWFIHHLPKWNLPASRAWWYKMEIFNRWHGITGRNLYVDLDVIVTGDMTEMWNYENSKFVICQDFNRVFAPNISQVNSSVMAWRDDSMDWLYQKFIADRDNIIRRLRGDQDYITEQVTARSIWPREWAMSYRWEIWRGGHKNGRSSLYHSPDSVSVIPADCKLTVFHGRPKPHEITENILREKWIAP